MKFLILIALFVTSNVYAGTCTPISRTNNAANSVLTSTKYNTDVNTVYSAHNAFDGGCTTDGTLEKASLNTTDFAVPLNTLREGCRVTITDSNTVQVGACALAVNGNWVNTATVTQVAMGCATNCDAEASSTDYYVYAISGSDGTTLTLGLKTTAPNDNSYDDSNNRIIAKVYNDIHSELDTYAVQKWTAGNFEYKQVHQRYSISQAGNALTDRASEMEWNLGTATISNEGSPLLVAVDDSANTQTKWYASSTCQLYANLQTTTDGTNIKPAIYINGVSSIPNAYIGTARSDSDYSQAIAIHRMEVGDYFSTVSVGGSINNAGDIQGLQFECKKVLEAE